MPTGISRLGACGRREWVATIFAAVEISAALCPNRRGGLHSQRGSMDIVYVGSQDDGRVRVEGLMKERERRGVFADNGPLLISGRNLSAAKPRFNYLKKINIF